MAKNQDDSSYKNVCNIKTLQSQQRGFFLEFVNHVLNESGEEWLKNTFSKLKNDNSRVKAIFQDKQIKENVNEILQNIQQLYRPKSAAISREKRNQADKVFDEGKDLQKALMLYGQAILRAPPKDVEIRIDGGLSLAIALWKRTDVLLALKEYALALSDLQTAIKEGLPAKQKADLYWKMATCYMGLGEVKKAQVSQGLAEKLETDAEKKELMKNLLKQYEKTKPEPKEKFEPKIKGEKNKKFKNASKLIRVAETPKLGRHMVANEEIVAGDTLVVEEPYAACLMPEYYGSHCLHCFKKVLAPVGCYQCAGIAFCSPSCRDVAINSYHKYECKIMDFLIGSGMSTICHLALRMITKFSFEQCFEIYKNKEKLPIYKLCTLAKNRDGRDFLHRTLMAAFLLRCLQLVDYFPTKASQTMDPSEDELKIMELLLTHLQFLQFNAHEIMEPRKSTNPEKVKEQSIAIAVYPTASLFNHDCYPSVLRYFHDNKIVLVANQIIKPGQMVSENYGPLFTRISYEERQRNLESRYWFKCECQACVLRWPLLSDVDESFAQLKCPTEKCTGMFILPDVSGKCNKCGTEPNLDDALVKLTECENEYRQGLDLMRDQNYKNAIESFSNGLNIFHRIAIAPHVETHKAQDYLKNCYIFLSNTL